MRISLVLLAVVLVLAGSAPRPAPGQEKPAAAQSQHPEQPGGAKEPTLTAEQKAKLQERKQLIARVKELQAKGNLADAARLRVKEIALAEAIFGQAHEEVATSLNSLAVLYYEMGRYADAVPLCQRSLKIREARLGKDHRHVATSLNDLASLYQAMGRYADAEPLYQRSLKIREAQLGKDHPAVAIGLNNLAALYRATGRHADAAPLYQRSLKILESRLGKDHPAVAASLNNLAELYRAMGRYADAEPLYQRSLEINEAKLGTDHPRVADSLNNLAELYQDMGRHADAAPLYQRSLKIYEARLGADHPDVATSLNNLAELYRAMGRYADAAPLHQRSLKILESRLGKDHPDVAISLNNLALLYRDMGRYADAEPLYQRSLKIREARLGKEHPAVATSLNNLACLYRDMGRYADAAPLYRQALRVVAAHLDKTGAFLPERQLLALAHRNRFFQDSYLSMAPADGAAADAYAWVLAWKGQAFLQERELQLARRLHSADDLETAALYRRLEHASRQLATLALADPAPGKALSPEELKQRTARLAELSQEVETLKQDLAARSQAFRRAYSAQQLTPAKLAAALPKDGMLVDFLEYSHSAPPKAGKGPLQVERRLLAFVVRPDGKIDRVDLGGVAPIDTAVDEWRKSFGRSPAGHKSATLLRQLVWAPLESKLQGAALVLVSPDGPLGRFPLAALPGKKPGTYLIEDWALTVIPVPRLLPALLETAKDKEVLPSLLALGDVDYGAEAGQPDRLASNRSAARAGDFPAWKALTATRGEMLAVRDSFEQRFPEGRARLLRGSLATEDAFRKEAPKHRWLHLATHGFFAAPELRSALGRTRGKETASLDPFGDKGIGDYHPGLLSGLVLAGANRPRTAPDQDDGILTALEVAALDLSGVDLAVLSACETGLGERAGGEGLLGLQRAFQVAGARSVVASLWQVDDKATRVLMERFYDNLWTKKLPRLEALREAQLWMLREGRNSLRGLGLVEPTDTRLPPFYWAAFVLSGDWR